MLNKVKEALEAYQKFNPLHNDREAYLFAMGEWALEDQPKPNPDDYGMQEKC